MDKPFELIKAIAEIDMLSSPRMYPGEILKTICTHLGYSFGTVIEVDHRGRGSMPASHNLPPDYPEKVKKVKAPALSGPAGEAVEKNRTVMLHNPLADPRMAPWRQLLQPYNIKTMVWVPLKKRERTSGVYVLYDTRIRDIPEQELIALEQTALLMSIAIAGNLYLDRLNRKTKEFRQEITERKQTEKLLNHHLEFIKLISAISSDFINIDTTEIDGAVNRALQLIVRFTAVERGYVFLLSADGKRLELTHEWCAEKVPAHKGILESIAVADFQDFVDSLKRGEIARVHAADIPRTPESKSMTDVLDLLEIKSFINLPMTISNKFIGYIGFDATIKQTEWSDEVVNAFNLTGEIIGNTLTRKLTEEALRESEERLVRREKLAMLGQLAGGVGHELRNPLGVIKNAAYFLNMALENPGPEVKETLEILDKEVVTSERIISGLLDFARARPPHHRKVNIREILRKALAGTGVPKNIAIEKQVVEPLPGILADPDQLGQVFGNILLNAIQAMPEGGRLIIKSEAPDPGWVTVSITDTGIGISEGNLAKIFEPLFTGKAKGIGLGMAISKTFVEGHGGSIEVSSQPGKGSTFTVKLPVAPPGK